MPKVKPKPFKARPTPNDMKRKREYRECKSKLLFQTAAAAQEHLDKHHAKDWTIAAYRCSVCGLLHIGHPRKGKVKILDRQ